MKRTLRIISTASSVILATNAASLSLPAYGAETDNFTGRDQELAELKDSTEVLDEFVNQKLREAIAASNEQGHCRPDRLYENVWYRVGHNPISETENFAENSPLIQSYLVPFKNSIYGSVPSFLEEKRFPRAADLFVLTGWFSGSIRLNNQIIGTDKLGHFFGQGWEYFQTGSLKEALALGIQDEEGLDGYIGSGVYSYGDLSANFAGLGFWKSLLGGPTPYVECREGRFVFKRAFSWRDYVTSAWDEALNCSKYVTPQMASAVQGKISQLHLSCPAEPSTCQAMLDASPCSALTVNPVCFQITGMSPEKKSQECAKLMEGEQWGELSRDSVGSLDRILIKADTFVGIAGMSLHYIKRDYFNKKPIRSGEIPFGFLRAEAHQSATIREEADESLLHSSPGEGSSDSANAHD